jgi:PIN domain nuclease of toxin-antitoxin system
MESRRVRGGSQDPGSRGGSHVEVATRSPFRTVGILPSPGLPAPGRQAGGFDAVRADEQNECYVSFVSAWEMAMKAAIGKLKLAVPVKRYIQEQLPANAIKLLPLSIDHVTAVESLPLHHRDPFDRLLVAQAQQELLSLVSVDASFDQYGVARIW